MIKFGIPSVSSTIDSFPGRAVITLCALDKPNSKRKFSLSKTAAQQLGVEPGLSKVGFSFDGGNFIAVIPDSVQGIAANDRLLVNKELGFISKKAYEYLVEKCNLDTDVDNYLPITSVETNYGMKIGSFDLETIAREVYEDEEVPMRVVENDDLI